MCSSDLGLLENEDPDALEFRYSAHGGHGNMALTELVPNAEGRIEDNAPIRITFYPDAFAQGPGVLYSTFRHELIHAGQRSLTPNSEDDEEAPGTSLDDDYIHDDLYEPLNTLEGRAKVNPNMQLPLQELETHSWEIMNAQRTGVGPDYTWTTIYYMIEYQKKLSNYLGVLDERKNKETKVKKVKSNSGRGKASRNVDPILAERMLNYWRSYIVKALGLAHEAYGYYCGHLDGSEAHKAAAQAASEEADQLMRVMA
mgnify:FL=1